MKTTKIKVTDMQTLQMEKQRLKMQIDYTEEQILDMASNGVYNLPVQIISYVLPFGLGQKPGVVKLLNRTREFISGNVMGAGNSDSKKAIVKVLMRVAQTFVVKSIGRAFQKKNKEEV